MYRGLPGNQAHQNLALGGTGEESEGKESESSDKSDLFPSAQSVMTMTIMGIPKKEKEE